MQPRCTLAIFACAALLGGPAACGSVVDEEPDDAAGDDTGDGDGAADAPEADDDGGTDGTGEDAPEADGVDVPVGCGDGVVDDGEECDDGNERSADGCEPDCTFTCSGDADCSDDEPCNGSESCVEHVCTAGTGLPDGTDCTDPEERPGRCRDRVCVTAQCPNGVVEPGEECDDGNADAGDGCEPDCTFTCVTGADCDDGRFCNGAEGCSEDHVCVPGTWPGEGDECEVVGGGEGGCFDGVCVPVGCGNGRVDTGEECDDGNDDATDACLPDCRNASCGDGFVWAGREQCDGGFRECVTSCGTGGTQACTGDCRWSDCLAPTEVCNGADDDCDTLCDDGFTCCEGATVSGSESGCPYTQTCLDGCSWGSRSYGTTPANDTCASPTPITLASGFSGRATGSNCAANDDYTPSCMGVTGGRDLVFSFTIAERKFVSIDTEGSSYDTILQLGGSESGGCPGTSIACNDDIDATNRASRVTAMLEPGTYWILLDAFGASARGSFVINLYATSPPENDDCDGAIALSLGLDARTQLGSTAVATDDRAPCAGTSVAGPDVWYSFTLGAAPHLMYFDLLDGQSWNGALRLYDGCRGTQIACAGTGACGTTRPRLALVLGEDGVGRTYYIAVDGRAATDKGLFTLRYQMAGPSCTTATPLTASGSYTGSLGGIAGLTAGSCGGAGPEAMYYMPLCPGRTIVADTCSPSTAFPPVLYARRNGCGIPTPPAGSELACNAGYSSVDCGYPNNARITFGGSSLGAGLYFLFVDSNDVTGTSARDFGLNVSGM